MVNKKANLVITKITISFKKCGITLKLGNGTKDKNPEEVDCQSPFDKFIYVWYDNHWYRIVTHFINNEPCDDIFVVKDYLTLNTYSKEQVLEKLLNII